MRAHPQSKHVKLIATSLAICSAVIILVFVQRPSLSTLPVWSIASSRRAKEGEDRILAGGGSHAKLRIAAFGSSVTWGFGLEDRYDAYPYRLSNEVDNYATISGSPNFPSVCAQSLIGDDKIYDVILLDFWLKARQGLGPLAERLRQRFPHALILLVKLWEPIHARRRPNEMSSRDEEMTFEQWRDSKFEKYPQVNAVVQALADDNGFWFFPTHGETDLLMGQIRQAVGAYNVRILKKDTAKETLMFYLPFFNHQNAQLSAKGHEFLANMIKGTIEVKLANYTTDEFIGSSNLGTWGGGDICKMWFTSGGFGGQHHPSWVMNNFDADHGKFALEVREPGWFVVHNDFEEERALYLSFLATKPGQYPVTTATIGETGAPVDLIPDNVDDQHDAHNPRTVHIGMIPPGENKIYLTPKDGTAPLFFRLVGFTIPNPLVTPSEFHFGPEFNN